MNDSIKKIKNKLFIDYKKKEGEIKKRLNEFSIFYNENFIWTLKENNLVLLQTEKNTNQRLFEEICFCILTANGSALSGIKAIDFSRDVLIKGTKEEIQEKLKKSGVRFHNRAEYIYYNREKLKKDFNFEIKKLIETKKENKQELRNFFVSYIKGLGYKEASHFLRNIGFFDYAILDKHILRNMQQFNIINEIPKTLNKNRYLELEKKFFELSNYLQIKPGELDLLLWSLNTGKILK
ncbi:MAG: N-glycosylase/DNA lyase [Candidatus Woesearchaeota archaeon]